MTRSLVREREISDGNAEKYGGQRSHGAGWESARRVLGANCERSVKEDRCVHK